MLLNNEKNNSNNSGGDNDYLVINYLKAMSENNSNTISLLDLPGGNAVFNPTHKVIVYLDIPKIITFLSLENKKNNSLRLTNVIFRTLQKIYDNSYNKLPTITIFVLRIRENHYNSFVYRYANVYNFVSAECNEYELYDQNIKDAIMSCLKMDAKNDDLNFYTINKSEIAQKKDNDSGVLICEFVATLLNNRDIQTKQDFIYILRTAQNNFDEIRRQQYKTIRNFFGPKDQSTNPLKVRTITQAHCSENSDYGYYLCIDCNEKIPEENKLLRCPNPNHFSPDNNSIKWHCALCSVDLQISSRNNHKNTVSHLNKIAKLNESEPNNNINDTTQTKFFTANHNSKKFNSTSQKKEFLNNNNNQELNTNYAPTAGLSIHKSSDHVSIETKKIIRMKIENINLRYECTAFKLKELYQHSEKIAHDWETKKKMLESIIKYFAILINKTSDTLFSTIHTNNTQYLTAEETLKLINDIKTKIDSIWSDPNNINTFIADSTSNETLAKKINNIIFSLNSLWSHYEVQITTSRKRQLPIEDNEDNEANKRQKNNTTTIVNSQYNTAFTNLDSTFKMLSDVLSSSKRPLSDQSVFFTEDSENSNQKDQPNEKTNLLTNLNDGNLENIFLDLQETDVDKFFDLDGFPPVI